VGYHLRHKSSPKIGEERLDQIKSLSESIQKTTQSIVEQIENIEEAAENNPVLIDDTSEQSFSPKKSGTNTPRSLADLD